MAEKAITRRLKIYVNGKEVDATITNLRKNLAKFRAQANRATEGSDDWKRYNQEVARTELELKQAYEAQKQFRQETKLTEQGINKNAQSLADFSGSLNQVFQGLKRGDYLQVSDGFEGIGNGIKGATKAALAFIATPIGLAITALVGIGAAAKSWFEYNSQVVEALRLTQQITGLTDQAADQARIRGEALQETFGVDFKETLETAKAISQQFGIGFNEAMDVIEEGLVRGGKNNDEFFQSLKEYPAFFASAGFSADEFRKVIETGYNLGIYTDKLPDALKEADISLKEQTQSTRDALVNAFGASFTNDILNRVKRGEITTKQALEEISKKADEVGINLQQNAQLTADVFRGAGEDAGGAKKVLEAFNKALNEQQRELTESEKITQQQINATKELKQVSSALFATGDKGFGLLIDKAKLFGTKLLVDILKAGVDVYNWFVDLNNESTIFSGIIVTIGKVFTLQFKIIGEIISLAIQQFKSLGTVIEGIFTFDFDKVKAGFKQGFDNIGAAIDNIKDKILKDAEDIKGAFSGEFKLERKTIDNFVSTTSTTTNNDDDDDDDDDDNDLTDEDQKRLDSRKKLLELLKQFEEEQKIQDALKKLEEDQRAEEEEILRLELKFQKLEEEYAAETDLLDDLESAKQEQLQNIRDKYADIRTKKQELEQKKLLDEEKKFREAALKAEETFQKAKANALQFGLETLRSVVGQETELGKILFAFEKAKAISEVLKSTSEAVAIANANEAKIPAFIHVGATTVPNPIKPLSLAATAKTIASAKTNSAIQIGSIIASAIQGFEQGGFTENSPTIALDGNKKVKGFVHDNEYVIPEFVRKDPEVPQIIDYLETKRKRKLNGFESGGEVSDTATINPATNSDNTNVLMKLLEAVDTLNDILPNLKINFTLEDERERRTLAQKLEDLIKAAEN